MRINEVNQNINTILKEIGDILISIDQKEVNLLVKEIIKAKNIVLIGAGRMGLSCKAFSMRLSHLGLRSYFLGDSNVPSVGKGDLILIASGSGETQTVYDIAKIAKKGGARIFLITANPKSRMGRLSHGQIRINAPSKTRRIPKSIQPMTTLNEQCLQIFFDAVVLMLMRRMRMTHDSMYKKHTNLE